MAEAAGATTVKSESDITVKADGDTMQSFQKHIEDMRSLTLCKICLKPFFEPYIISCGHTYCYGCLRSWFGDSTTDRKKTKSCPDCRVTVKVQPAPNYILRDLTHMFIDRAELLPEDESVQEHAQDKEDAAAQLTKDREGPGLFQGVFKDRRDFPYMHPLRDFQDGVDRCPACLHEIEDGMCSGCGRPFSDYESESEDSVDAAMPMPPQRAFYGVESDSDEDDTEDESNISGPDEYDRHDDFLDNEDEDDMDDLDEAEMAEADLYRSHRLAPFGYNAAVFRPIVGSDDDSNDDEDNDHDVRATWMGRRLRAPGSPRLVSEDSATNYDESDEEEQDLDSMNHDMERFESDNDQPTDNPGESSSPTAAAPPRSRRRPVVVSDDEDDGTAQEEDNTHSPRVRTALPISDEDSDEDGTMSNQSSDSELDSDSEDSGNSESENHREPQEVEDTEDSDDTILPPQSRHMRKQRLQSQRARRPHQHQARASSTDLSTPPRRDYLYDRRDDTLAQRGSRGRAARVY